MWYLALWVRLNLPASWKLQLCICKLVEEGDQVSVVLVPLKVTGIPADLQNHVLQTGAVGEHPVGPLKHSSAQPVIFRTAPQTIQNSAVQYMCYPGYLDLANWMIIILKGNIKNNVLSNSQFSQVYTHSQEYTHLHHVGVYCIRMEKWVLFWADICEFKSAMLFA